MMVVGVGGGVVAMRDDRDLVMTNFSTLRPTGDCLHQPGDFSCGFTTTVKDLLENIQGPHAGLTMLCLCVKDDAITFWNGQDAVVN